MAKDVIITASDEKNGDFLVNHWLRSLKENLKLDNIDVVVIGYGLTEDQKQELGKGKAIIFHGNKTGHIVNSRFIDAGKFLENSDYGQVLFCDSSDMIFQEDMTHLFGKDRNIFRAVPLEMEVLFYEAFIPFNFDKAKGKIIYQYLKDKPILNAGFILAPKEKFVRLCEEIGRMVKNKKAYGPDQIALNYFIHRNGVKLLPNNYNFMINTARQSFVIRDGIFYKNNGEKIAVVHNAGHDGFQRPIVNFGYGKGFNRINFPMYFFKRFLYSAFAVIKNIFNWNKNVSRQ